MEYVNYSVGKDGLYTSSKTPKEGYKKTIYGINSEKVTYKKNVRQIEGVVSDFKTDEFVWEGVTMKMFKLSLKDGETIHTLSGAIKNQKGTNYSDVFTQTMSALNGYKKGQRVSLSAYYKKSTGKDGKEYNNLTIAMNHLDILTAEGKPEWTGFIPFTDTPRAEKVEARGEITFNWDKAMDFWFAKYTELHLKFGYQASNTVEVSSATPPPPAMQPNQSFESKPLATANSQTEEEDLPF